MNIRTKQKDVEDIFKNLMTCKLEEGVRVKKEPLFSLLDIGTNKPFPPTSQHQRLALYTRNRQLLDGDVVTAIPSINQKLTCSFDTTTFSKVNPYVQNIKNTNFVDLMVKAATRFIKFPHISIENKQYEEEISLFSDKLYKSKLIRVLVSELIICGEAIVFNNKKDNDYKLEVIEASNWFPVKDIVTGQVCHIIVNYLDDNNSSTKLVELRLINGSRVEKYVYVYNGTELGELLGEVEVTEYGEGIAPLYYFNNGSSESLFGYDYVNNLVPNISSYITTDTLLNFYVDQMLTPTFYSKEPIAGEDGIKKKFNGVLFAEGINVVSYDAKLEHAKDSLDRTLNHIAKESGFEGTINSVNSSGNNQSFVERRLRYKADIDTVNALKDIILALLPRVIKDCLACRNVKINESELSITWNVELELEQSEIVDLEASKVNNMLSSRKSSLKRLGLKEELLDSELIQIFEEYKLLESLKK